MSKFSITYSKKEKDKVSQELESDHQEFLKEMKQRQKILRADPLDHLDKYHLVIKEKSKEEALNIVYRDPYIQTGFYQTFKLAEIT